MIYLFLFWGVRTGPPPSPRKYAIACTEAPILVVNRTTFTSEPLRKRARGRFNMRTDQGHVVATVNASLLECSFDPECVLKIRGLVVLNSIVTLFFSFIIYVRAV